MCWKGSKRKVRTGEETAYLEDSMSGEILFLGADKGGQWNPLRRAQKAKKI